MALITRSDRVYAAPAILTVLSAAVQSAAKFMARVQADGGDVISSSLITDNIAFLIGQSVSTNQFVAGPGMAIKTDGSAIYKVYSLDGNDLILLPSSGTAGKNPKYDHTTYAYPVVSMTHTVPLNGMRTQRLTRVQAGDGYCIAQAARDDGSDGNYAFFNAHYPSGANVPPFGILPLNGVADGATATWGYAPRPGYSTTVNQAETTACQRLTGSSYAAFDGVCLHARQSTGVVKMYINNVQTDTATDPAASLFDMRQQAVYLSCGYNESSGTTHNYGKFQFAELWQVNDCSETFAQALSNRLGTVY